MTVLERSRRSAGTSYAHSDAFKEFLERLRNSDKSLGDSDGRVLRLKRYLPSDVGPKVRQGRAMGERSEREPPVRPPFPLPRADLSSLLLPVRS